MTFILRDESLVFGNGGGGQLPEYIPRTTHSHHYFIRYCDDYYLHFQYLFLLSHFPFVIVASWTLSVAVVIVVFDLSDVNSLAHTPQWKEDACKCACDPHVFLVGTKKDLVVSIWYNLPNLPRLTKCLHSSYKMLHYPAHKPFKLSLIGRIHTVRR